MSERKEKTWLEAHARTLSKGRFDFPHARYLKGGSISLTHVI